MSYRIIKKLAINTSTNEIIATIKDNNDTRAFETVELFKNDYTYAADFHDKLTDLLFLFLSEDVVIKGKKACNDLRLVLDLFENTVRELKLSANCFKRQQAADFIKANLHKYAFKNK